MHKLFVSTIRKRFGAVTALDNVSFGVEPGEFFCVVGPTNAGKSTLLKTIAGLYRADSGEIHIEGENVTRLLPHERRISLLFQNIALFPALSGFENMAFPLRAAGLADPEIKQKVDTFARLLRVERILDRRPATFSGGEQQRVAIGRSLVRPGRVLMLDEPLTNLDAALRIELRIEFKKLHREFGQTIIYVTHDQVEAMSLSDRVAVLDRGRIQQIGSPDDVYHRPESQFVAQFIGSPPMNLLDAEVSERDSSLCAFGKGFKVTLSALQGQVLKNSSPSGGIALGIRPEEIEVGYAESSHTPIPADVVWIEMLGSKSILAIRVGETILKAVVKPTQKAQAEGRVWIGLPAGSLHILDRTTGLFLREARRRSQVGTH